MSMNLHLHCVEANGEIFDSFPLYQTPTLVTNEILGGEGVWEMRGKEPYLLKYLKWAKDYKDHKKLLKKWIAKREKYVTGCVFEWYKL